MALPAQTRRPLFGGAMSCDTPSSFIDVSDLRSVPDNQEVWADMGGSDQSVIVELLEQAEEVERDEDAPRYYFQELAETNEAEGRSTVQSVRRLTPEEMPQCGVGGPGGGPSGSSAWMLVGQQAVAKFHEGPQAANTVRIYMAVLRLPSVGTDLLFTMNVPLVISPSSSSAKPGVVGEAQGRIQAAQGQAGAGAGDGARMEVESEDQAAADPYSAATATFLHMVRSFNIHDWGLFDV
jgi:hypothetical protein